MASAVMRYDAIAVLEEDSICAVPVDRPTSAMTNTMGSTLAPVLVENLNAAWLEPCSHHRLPWVQDSSSVRLSEAAHGLRHTLTNQFSGVVVDADPLRLRSGRESQLGRDRMWAVERQSFVLLMSPPDLPVAELIPFRKQGEDGFGYCGGARGRGSARPKCEMTAPEEIKRRVHARCLAQPHRIRVHMENFLEACHRYTEVRETERARRP